VLVVLVGVSEVDLTSDLRGTFDVGLPVNLSDGVNVDATASSNCGERIVSDFLECLDDNS